MAGKTPAAAAVPRHIVWDWNGTLLNDTLACLTALNRMLARRGLPGLTPRRYRESFSFPVRACYEAWGFDTAAEDWDAMAREYHDDYALTSAAANLRPGTREALSACAARGVAMSILSACEQGLLDAMLRRYAIGHFFEHVCGLGDLYGGSKLDAGRRLMARLAAPPDTVLLVGDTTHDYEVARALNCRCVLLTGGHQSERRLDGCGCPVLPGVTAVVP